MASTDGQALPSSSTRRPIHLKVFRRKHTWLSHWEEPYEVLLTTNSTMNIEEESSQIQQAMPKTAQLMTSEIIRRQFLQVTLGRLSRVNSQALETDGDRGRRGQESILYMGKALWDWKMKQVPGYCPQSFIPDNWLTWRQSRRYRAILHCCSLPHPTLIPSFYGVRGTVVMSQGSLLTGAFSVLQDLY